MSAPTYRHGFFPFPVPETTDSTDVGIGTPYLVGLSFEAAVELFWRAKKLSVSAPLVGTSPMGSSFGSSAYPSVDVVGDFSSGTSVPIMICRLDGVGPFFPVTDEIRAIDLPFINATNANDPAIPPGIFFPNLPSNHTDPANGPPSANPDDPDNWFGTYNLWMFITMSAQIFEQAGDNIIGNIQSPCMVKFGDLYYPSLSFSVRLDIVEGFDHVPDEIRTEVVGYNASYGSGDIISGGSFGITGSVFGVDIGSLNWTLDIAPIVQGGFGGAVRGQTITGFDKLSIKIEEWWPHDPKDGHGPFYDATTGGWIERS